MKNFELILDFQKKEERWEDQYHGTNDIEELRQKFRSRLYGNEGIDKVMSCQNHETKEVCWVILGNLNENYWCGKLHYMSVGTPASVAFDWKEVLALDEKEDSVLGFLHTHPSFPAFLSDRDHRTMQAWVFSLGKPLICAINGTDGLRAFCYYNDEEPAMICPMAQIIGDFIFGEFPKIDNLPPDESDQLQDHTSPHQFDRGGL